MRRSQESQQVIIELVSVETNEGDMVLTWVDVEGLVHISKFLCIALRHWNEASVLILSNELSNWNDFVQ